MDPNQEVVEVKKKKVNKKVQEVYNYKISELDEEYDLLIRFDSEGNLKNQKKLNKYDELFANKQLIISKPPQRGSVKESIIIKDKEFKLNYYNVPNKRIVVQFSSLFNKYLNSINTPSSLSEIAIEEIVKSFDSL